jgi:hypothetical protein
MTQEQHERVRFHIRQGCYSVLTVLLGLYVAAWAARLVVDQVLRIALTR